MKKNVGGGDIAGLRLKAVSGWLALNPGEEANGLDVCGFSAFPAPRLKAVHYGYDAYFKTNTVSCDDAACDSTSFFAEYMGSNNRYVKQRVSSEPEVLRCVKD